MTPLEILKAARAKIEKPECWGKGYRGRRRGLDTCCAAEAFHKLPYTPLAIEYFLEAVDLEDDLEIPRWNDAPERTHSDVLKAFDRAIELAGGQS